MSFIEVYEATGSVVGNITFFPVFGGLFGYGVSTAASN